MKKLLVVGMIFASGCSSFGPQQVAALNMAIREGRCNDAATIASQTNDAVRFNNLGVTAEYCERNPQKARGYYEYGARLGERNAVSNLLRMGVPVPYADIKAKNDAEGDAAYSRGLMLLQAAQPKFEPSRMSPSVNCTSRAVGNTVQTSCN